MPNKTVGDLMHKGIIACRPDTPMTEVIRIVLDTDEHAIVVMDGDGTVVSRSSGGLSEGQWETLFASLAG